MPRGGVAVVRCVPGGPGPRDQQRRLRQQRSGEEREGEPPVAQVPLHGSHDGRGRHVSQQVDEDGGEGAAEGAEALGDAPLQGVVSGWWMRWMG